jgi:ribosomal protein S18 acetylase RimI-like enzyme
MLETHASNWGNVEDFWILEVAGNPVAGAASYTPQSADFRLLDLPCLDAIAERLKWSDEATQVFFQNYLQIFGEDPQAPFFAPSAKWSIEYVAVLPHMRGRGLGKVLVRALLDEGCKRGFTHAGIAVIYGNTIAEKTYKSLGFQPYQTFYADYFDGAFPGITKLRMRLNEA